MDTAKPALSLGAALGAAVLAALALLAAPASPAPQAKLRAVQGGTLTMARATDVFNFDPQNAPDQESVSTVLELYDRVVQFAPGSAKIRPGIATSWKFTADQKSVTFTLRKGVRFSDGSPLRASDVVYSVTRALNPKSIYAVLWGNAIKSVKALDDLHVRIDLKRPFAPLLSTLATSQGSIVSAAAWKRFGKTAAQHPVGSGPWALQSWSKGSQIVLVRNTHYWGPKPHLDKVILKVVGDDSARVLQLRSGAVDVIDTVPPSQVASIRSSGSKVEIVFGQSNLLIPMNVGVKPLGDVNVRQALSYALDRAAVAKAAYFGLAKPALSPLPSGTLFYKPAYAVPYSLAKAKAFLAKSSAPKGFSFTLTVPAGNSAFSGLAQIWAESLKKIGVTAKIVQLEGTTAFDRWLSKKYEVLLQPWANDTPDAMEYTELGFAGQDAFFTGYKNPDAKRLAAAGEATLDPAQRQKVYTQVQQIVARDVPQIYALALPILWASTGKVQGFSPNAQGAYGFASVSKNP